jgi:hypothetical protein
MHKYRALQLRISLTRLHRRQILRRPEGQFLPVWLICIAAQFKALSVIPANGYGYAATFAYLLQTPDRLTLQALTTPNLNNAFIVVGLSLVLGAVLGYVSGRIGSALKKA